MKKNVRYMPKSIQGWRDLYLAALFETDSQQLASRVAVAEAALRERARQLLATSEHRSEEGKAVDKGLYALRALRDCLALRSA
jgi:hypothetical protein